MMTRQSPQPMTTALPEAQTRTWTFFWVTNTTLSLPRTATDVRLLSLAARNAYSAHTARSLSDRA